MTTQVSDSALDEILALQCTIAWAGEGRCSPRRLGWWDTDLIDESGGGDWEAERFLSLAWPRKKDEKGCWRWDGVAG
jgi:hypothetical protein